MIDRATGQVTSERAEYAPPARFRRRVRELRESLPDLADVQARIAILVCNGCAAVAELDATRPVRPAGWRERRGGDFCPPCTAAGRPADPSLDADAIALRIILERAAGR